MRIKIRKKDIELTDPILKYVEEKIIIPVKKKFSIVTGSEMPILDLELERTSKHHHKGKVYRVEANLNFGKKTIHAEAVSEDMRQSCDLLEAELTNELKKFISKKASLEKRASLKIKRSASIAKPLKGRNALRSLQK